MAGREGHLAPIPIDGAGHRLALAHGTGLGRARLVPPFEYTPRSGGRGRDGNGGRTALDTAHHWPRRAFRFDGYRGTYGLPPHAASATPCLD
jgi:hypothetical protein